MASIVTTNMRVYAANQFIGGFSNSNQSIYLFIGHTLPWTEKGSSDITPPTPVDCEADQSAAFREMMSAKLVGPSNVCLVAARYDWTLGMVYTQYNNSINLFDPTSGIPPFYVITNDLNVYKCISNANGVASTVEPTGTSLSNFTLSDGYVWKYMFTVRSADVLNFVTNEWIPVRLLTVNDGSQQWLVQTTATSGTVDRIDMVMIGSQYTTGPTVTINGDGTGATASAILNSGSISSIVVTNPGSGYTYANVVITGGGVGANGATAVAQISPFGGHGSNPVSELGAMYAMVDCKLTYDENGTFTVNNDYRRVGLLENPLMNDGTTQATNLDINQMVRLTFGSVSLSGSFLNGFQADETVVGSISGATGVVVDYSTTSGSVLRLAEVVGKFVPGESVIGQMTDTSGTLVTFTGTAVSGTSTTVVLPSTASAASGAYTGQSIVVTSGLGAGQAPSVITNYVGNSRTVTFSPALSQAPNGSSVMTIGNIVLPDLKPFTGEILYMENRRPISRSSDQVEDVKVVVQF